MSREYIEFTGKTDHEDYAPVVERCSNPETAKLLHYSLGLVTEAAEVADLLKKYIAYGKDFTELKLQDEMGDVLWYLARICKHLGVDFERLMAQNIAKLTVRFGDKFAAESAINRNLDAENKAMEGANNG